MKGYTIKTRPEVFVIRAIYKPSLASSFNRKPLGGLSCDSSKTYTHWWRKKTKKAQNYWRLTCFMHNSRIQIALHYKLTSSRLTVETPFTVSTPPSHKFVEAHELLLGKILENRKVNLLDSQRRYNSPKQQKFLNFDKKTCGVLMRKFPW